MTRNKQTQVSSMPPIMISLSWVARFSISRITVLDSPSMLATSSIFLWVPCARNQSQESDSRGGGQHNDGSGKALRERAAVVSAR